MNGLLKLAIEGHGGLRRWEQLSRFRVAEENGTWSEDGQTWRRLLVTYPDTFGQVCSIQVYVEVGSPLGQPGGAVIFRIGMVIMRFGSRI